MATLDELEKLVWQKMEAAMTKRDTKSLAALNEIALEITRTRERVNELSAKLADLGSVNGAGASSAGHLPPTQSAKDVWRKPNPPGVLANYTNRPIRLYTLNGTRAFVRTYKELLITLSNNLRRKHGARFDEVALQLGGRKRTYFARSQRDLKYAQELDGGNLFAETNLNSNLIVHNICIPLIQRLEPDSSFEIE
jgi:hypothetical protein